MLKALQWEDWAGIAVGAWLLASPWVLGYSGETAAAMNALAMGTVLVLDEFMELGEHETSEEWIDVVAGVWLLISPVALGVASSAPAAPNTIAVGAITIVLALCAIWLPDRSHPTPV